MTTQSSEIQRPDMSNVFVSYETLTRFFRSQKLPRRSSWMRLVLAVCTVSALLCHPISSEETPTAEGVESAPDSGDQLDSLRVRMTAGEPASVIPILQRMIQNIESEADPFDDQLVEPLVLLGDAHFLLDQHADALDAYRNAFDVSRVVDGLFAQSQVRLAYREANLLARMGVWQEANSLHEYAYSITVRKYDEEDPRRIQGIINLVDWYESTRKFGAALVLYGPLREYVHEHYPPAHPFAIAIRRGYVQAIRETTHPTPTTRFSPRFRVQVPNWDPRKPRRIFNPYLRGQKELETVSQLILSNPVSTDVERAAALLELADWHVLFNRPHKGINIYRQAWDLLEPSPELLQKAFAKPQIIHMRVNRQWLSPESDSDESRNTGTVRLSLTINNRGIVVGRKTVSTFPDNRMEYRARVVAEHAKYRPAFKDREPVRSRNVPFVYNYALQSAPAKRR